MTSEDPVIVAEWKYSEFVWWTKFVEGLPGGYEKLLEFLKIPEERYSFELQGFHACEHDLDPNRRCDVDVIYLPIIRSGRYHPYSSVKHKRRAARRTLERLEFLEEECRRRRVEFDYLIKIDLTLPKQVSELWNSRKVERCVRKAVSEFLRGLYAELFPKYHSRFGSPCNHHIWATKSPLDAHRHIHLNVPNVVFNKKTDMFHRIKPQIDHAVIKRVWKKCLKENGLWPDVPDRVKADAYVGYIPFADRNRVIHRLSYCCRRPIEDLVRSLRGSDLDDFDEGFALFLLDYTPQIINLGFLRNLKRFGYSRKPNSMKCPICGGEMALVRNEWGEVVLYDRPPPDVPQLFQDRGGNWRRA